MNQINTKKCNFLFLNDTEVINYSSEITFCSSIEALVFVKTQLALINEHGCRPLHYMESDLFSFKTIERSSF